MIITSIKLTAKAPSGDIKAMHDLVIQAALAGGHPRPVLWVQPSPRLLIVRHDRSIRLTDLPPGYVEETSHRPYWLPPAGAVIDWAVTVDAGQSGQTKAQHAKEIADFHAGLLPTRQVARDKPKARSIRTPERMLELVTGRLAPLLDIHAASAVRHTPRPGLRAKEGRTMWSNQVLLRGVGTVLDEQGMHALMLAGIGRHRSFGCGLILARPAAVRAAAC